MNEDDFSSIPAEMKALPQWVCWYFGEREGKTTKIPYSVITKSGAKSNDANTWTSFENAYQEAQNTGLFTGQNATGKRGGIGFMFANGYCGVDLDHVIDNSGNLKEFAADIVQTLDSYTELSPSGTGLHIFIKINEPLSSIGARRKINFDDISDIEIYDTGRFFTVTGKPYEQTRQITERTEALKGVYTKYFPAQKTKTENKNQSVIKNNSTPLTEPQARNLWQKIFNATNGAKYEALFNGDTSAYSGDDSAADLALCDCLAFWTKGNPAKIDYMFRMSKLFRPKWDEFRGSKTYGQITIDNAIESFSQKDFDAAENQSVFKKRDAFLQNRKLLFHGSIRGGSWFSYNSQKGFWVYLSDADIQADVSHFFGHREKTRSVTDIVTQCRFVVTVQIRPKFNKAPLMSFKNGVLELDTGFFRNPKPEDFLTWQVGYDYNPAATCELFDKFICQITQNETSRMNFLDDLGGYIMFPDCRLEKCFFLLGDGGNGKSVYLNILDTLFTSRNEQEHSQSVTHIQPKDFNDSTKVVMLENALANIVYDIKPDLRGTEEIFKSLVSGEAVTGNLKFHDTHSFIPRAKIICSCNSIPLFNDSSAGLARRPLFCDFNVKFTPPDTTLLKRLQAEASGIFNRIYRAYCGLIDRERNGERDIIRPSCDQPQRLREFMTAANPVLEFWFADYEYILNQAQQNGGQISKPSIYSLFCEWCTKTKLTPFAASLFHRKFQSTLRNQGVNFQSERDSNHRGESYYYFPIPF